MHKSSTNACLKCHHDASLEFKVALIRKAGIHLRGASGVKVGTE